MMLGRRESLLLVSLVILSATQGEKQARLTPEGELQIKAYATGDWQNVCFQNNAINIETAITLCVNMTSFENPFPAIQEILDERVIQYSPHIYICEVPSHGLERCTYRNAHQTVTCKSSIHITCLTEESITMNLTSGFYKWHNEYQDHVIGLVQVSLASQTELVCADNRRQNGDLLQLCSATRQPRSTKTALAMHPNITGTALWNASSLFFECVAYRGRTMCGFWKTRSDLCQRPLFLSCLSSEPSYALLKRDSATSSLFPVIRNGLLYVNAADGSSWRPVCAESFGNEKARVACRSFGYPRELSFSIERYGRSGYLYSGRCTGSEPNLHNCTVNIHALNICPRELVVNLVCAPKPAKETVQFQIDRAPISYNTVWAGGYLKAWYPGKVPRYICSDYPHSWLPNRLVEAVCNKLGFDQFGYTTYSDLSSWVGDEYVYLSCDWDTDVVLLETCHIYNTPCHKKAGIRITCSKEQPGNKPKERSSHVGRDAGLAVTGFIILVLVVGFVVCLCRRKRQLDKRSTRRNQSAAGEMQIVSHVNDLPSYATGNTNGNINMNQDVATIQTTQVSSWDPPKYDDLYPDKPTDP